MTGIIIVELAIYAISFVCLFKIVTEIAQCGLLQIIIQRQPINYKAFKALLIGMATILVGILLQMRGHNFMITKPENIRITLIVFLAIPLFWLIILRYFIMPRGLFDYNKAKIRTFYWTEKYYYPGLALETKRKSLRNSFWAKRTIKLFKNALIKEERGTEYGGARPKMVVTSLNCMNIAVICQEMALLYRMMNLYREAHDALNQSYHRVEELLERDPQNTQYLELKSLILFEHAEAYQAQGIELEKARELYEESLAIDQSTGKDPEGVELIKRLMASMILC